MKINKKLILQFAKFAIVGIINTAIDWLSFYLLTNFVPSFSGTGEVWAKIIAFVFAVTNSFIMNSLWTFKEEFRSGFVGGDAKEKIRTGTRYFGKFLAVNLVGLLINSITFSIFRFKFGSSKLVGLIFASGAATFWNFLANKLWTYRKQKEIDKSKRKYDWLAAGILAIAAVICIFSMRQDSGIVDEIAHVPAGYSYVDAQDFRLNPEHPPLGKALAGVPLLFLNINDAYNDWSWEGIAQWENGWQLIYEEGNDADKILFWSRIPTVILFLILGIYLYKWGSELYGNRAGIFALILLVASPSVLAHARFVTTDVAAAVGFLISGYYFYKYYHALPSVGSPVRKDGKFHKSPSIKALIFAGIFFGIAQLLKFSCVLLVPIFGIAIITKSIIDRKDGGFWANFWKNLKPLFWIFVIGFLVIWLVYLFFTWNTSFDVERKVIELNLPTEGAAFLRNILISMAAIPIFKPVAHWLLGILMVFAHAEGGHTAFLLGNFSRTGWWYFFPVAWFFKVPIPVILLTFWSLIVLGFQRFKEKIDIFAIVLILTTIIIYWAISMRGALNIGIRHLIPTFPFIFLLIARAAQPILERSWSVSKVLLWGFAGWLIIETLISYPHFVSYFNEFRYVFGKQKHEILVDSSLDWGQDLKRLQKYVEENNIKEIKVDYFGGGVPSYYIPETIEWHSKYGKTTGWLAVSATFYQMSKYYGPLENQESYVYLDQLKPKTTIGDSILVFQIPQGYK